VYKPSAPGTSTLPSLCATTTISFYSDFSADSTAAIDVGRPTVKGITNPGNNTAFFMGNSGNALTAEETSLSAMFCFLFS
jgi:hypothetical protein